MRSFIGIALVIVLMSALAVIAVDAPRWVGVFPIQDKVGLKWQPVEGAETYAIYRSTAGGAEEKIAEVSETQYFDQQVEPGEDYSYTLKAVAAGTEGPASEVKSVTMPGTKKGELKGPSWVGIRRDRLRALLNWDPLKGLDVVAYNVQRSTTKGGPYETIGSTQETKFLDADLVEGQTYYYVLTALDANFTESPPSEEYEYSHGAPAAAAGSVEYAKAEDMIPIPMEYDFEVTEAGGTKLNAPSDVVVTSDGNIYIADVLNSRIVACDPKGGFKFAFGSRLTPDQKDNPPDGAFGGLFTLAVDAQDNIYATDIDVGDIQVFDKAGKFIKRLATRTIEGEREFCPAGIEVQKDGTILVADRDNHRLLKLDSDGKVIWQVGSEGSEDGQFISPNEICVNSKGIIYVIDVLNQRVQYFDQDGKFVGKFGGVGNIIGTFARPKGMYIDANDWIWVVDGLSNAIQVYGADNKVRSTVGGFEDKKLWLNNPRGAVVANGKLYLVDRNNRRLIVFKMI